MAKNYETGKCFVPFERSVRPWLGDQTLYRLAVQVFKARKVYDTWKFIEENTNLFTILNIKIEHIWHVIWSKWLSELKNSFLSLYDTILC